MIRMRLRNAILLVGYMSVACPPAPGQTPTNRRDGATFVDDTNLFARQLEKRAAGTTTSSASSKPAFKASWGGTPPPSSPKDFRQVWHQEPICQGLTGHCWAFASTSFFESEIHRASGRTIRLSEMYTVYWEFVEKARRFVATRGQSAFCRGSEPNATIRIWKRYGIVPASAYRGLPPGREFHDDRRMCAEMREHLTAVQTQSAWDEGRVIADIRAILDRHLGPPPESVAADGETMSPADYLRRVVRLDLDDYTTVMSLAQEPYNQWCEYDVPDNWWHSREYYNVSLDDLMRVVREADRSGRGLCLGGDDTEPGFLGRQGLAFVPTFDLPGIFIDDNARQFRFTNGDTTDDHAVHLIGFPKGEGDRWYLIKDSGTRAQNGPHPGYMFYHEDYIRLKTLTILLPRDVAERALRRSLR